MKLKLKFNLKVKVKVKVKLMCIAHCDACYSEWRCTVFPGARCVMNFIAPHPKSDLLIE